eukprot:jgi/Bigna1/136684/aug1.35_g11392
MPYALRKLGYVKSRPKKYRTPRKHYRYKYAAQKIREKTSGGVREFKGKPEKYVGEYTGIKISSIRSRRHDTSSFFNPDPVEPTMRRFFLPRIHRDGNLEPHPYAKGYDTITKSSDEEGEEGGGSFDEEGIGAPIENSSNGPKSEKKWKVFNENDNIFNEQQPEEADVDDNGSVRGRLSKGKRGSSSKQVNSADEEEDVEEDTADGRKKRKLNAFQNGNTQESDETTLELST